MRLDQLTLDGILKTSKSERWILEACSVGQFVDERLRVS